jgi:hypothetical protein
MITFEGYHGTDNAHVRDILDSGFKPSIGDTHWLGDGTYFFLKGKSDQPEVQAEQWACVTAWNKDIRANKYERYSVLKADITVKEANLLDLTEPSGLEIFEYIKHKIMAKSPRTKMIDGYLINFGRNELGLNLDVVKGDVPIKLTKEDRVSWFQSRIPNATICAVFNPNCISNIENIKTGTL